MFHVRDRMMVSRYIRMKARLLLLLQETVYSISSKSFFMGAAVENGVHLPELPERAKECN